MPLTILRTSSTSLRAARAAGALVAAGIGLWGAVVLSRSPGVEWPTSRLELTAASCAGLVFLFGFLGGILRLAQLAGSRRAQPAVRPVEVETLERAALTDSLTGLRNHRAFHEDAAREISRRNRTGSPFSLLMIDLNGLKQVNDTQGHQAGDERIRTAADCIRATVRDLDSGYRVGGDEFAVILPGERAWGALNAANRLHAETLRRGGVVALTVGIAESLATESKDTLVKRADLALYEAKNCHLRSVVFSPDLDPQRREPSLRSDRMWHMQELIAAALARAVDARDAGTRNHCETVGALSAMVGQRLGLEPDRIRQLRLAGLLHDVGKIGIADSILRKPSALADDEWEIMRTHSALGHSIVSATELLEEAGWVLHHHERFDGAGYPAGVSGEDIPLESRIIFVADAFEAITSDRPYRAGSTPDAALEELAANAGSQFDPLCVAALCAAFGYEPRVPLPVLPAAPQDACSEGVPLALLEGDPSPLKSPSTPADR